MQLLYERIVRVERPQKRMTLPFKLRALEMFVPEKSTPKRINPSASGFIDYVDDQVREVVVDHIKMTWDVPDDKETYKLVFRDILMDAANDPLYRRYFYLFPTHYETVRLRVHCLIVNQHATRVQQIDFFTKRLLPLEPEKLNDFMPALLWSLEQEARSRFKKAHFVGIWDVSIDKR